MKLTELVKVSFLGLLLVGIFSFPLLTATQLVKVLGVSTSAPSLTVKMVGDNETFVSEQGSFYTISYLTPGNHEVLEFKNNNLGLQSVNLTVSGQVSGEVKLLLAGQREGSLTPHNSSLPVSFTLNPGQAAGLNIEVTSGHGSSGVLTVSLKK